MFNFDSTTLNNTSLFGQSTPVNLNRTGNSFLFGNTNNTTPLSTPFLSTNLRGTNNIHKPSSLDTTTFHKYGSTGGLDKTNKHALQTAHHGKLSNDFGSDTLKSVIKIFPLENTQISTSTSSKLPILPSTTTANVSLDFSLSKPVITSSTTTPILFSIMNQATTSTVDLQSFRTMLNAQPFNNESDFLARQNKINLVHEETRLRSIMDKSITYPKTRLFSTILAEPIVLSSTSNKRKFVDSFVDDDDDDGDYNTSIRSSLIDDGPCSTYKLSKLNIKRPRMLDMNKVRSIVLGANEPYDEPIFNKSLPVLPENVNGWKKFSSYEEYISTKKSDVKQDPNLFRLPKLTHKDYFTKPTIEELRSSFNENGECFVKEFTIGRKHYGSVKFYGLHMNLAGLDLDRIVEIGRRQVTVYPNEEDRPAEGEELNCQAIISLLGIYPIDRSIGNGSEEITDPERLIDMNYGKYLEGITKKFHGKFIDYDAYTGTWSFQVEHF